MKTELREEYFNVVEESVLLRAKTERCSQFQISASETGLPAGWRTQKFLRQKHKVVQLQPLILSKMLSPLFPPSYPESDAVLPGGVLEPSPGHTVTGTSESQLYLSPVSSGQKLEPKTVRLRQAPVHPGQSSPRTVPRRWGRREGAATWSSLVRIRKIWVILQRNWLTAWREPVPLG